MELKSIFRKLTGRNTQVVRIPMSPGDKKEKYVTVPLTKSFQFLDFLSLRLAESDAYRLFQSEYGVVAGRVIGNEGVGLPNCRISIFVPRVAGDTADEITKSDLEKQLVDSLYPFENVTDDDGQGRRYNLLPAGARNRGYNGFPENDMGIGATPKVPVGTFSEKEDLLTNASLLGVYEKYYRFSTVTNESGDYMLFGVPTGPHTVHMDCDLTDIGPWSLSPLLMTQTLGYPKELFAEDGTKVIESTDFSTMPNIQSQNITLEVKPLWSQSPEANNIVGITRQDFKINAKLKPFFTIFGANFTMNKSKWWGDRVLFRIHYGLRDLCVNIWGNRMPDGGCDFRADLGISLDIDFWELEFSIEFWCWFIFPNIIPFISFEFFSNFCRLNGGKYDSTPIDFINHGATCKCSLADALRVVPDTGISDGMMLGAHRTEKLNIRTFNLKPDEIDDVVAEQIRTQIAAGTRVTANVNTETGIEVLRDSDYVKVVEKGQFILQVPTNRKLMVTAEDGRLVPSPDGKKGVFTEFRGYMYVDSDAEIDNPPTEARTSRIALKIPQKFDYSANNNGFNENGREWILDHGLFRAGEFYSVAQKYPTRLTNMTEGQEEDNESLTTQNVGWDNQTGMIMSADFDVNNPNDNVNGIIPNWTTKVGFDNNWANQPGFVNSVSPASNGGGVQTVVRQAYDRYVGEGVPDLYTGNDVNGPAVTQGFSIDLRGISGFTAAQQVDLKREVDKGPNNRNGLYYYLKTYFTRHTVVKNKNLTFFKIRYQGTLPTTANALLMTLEIYVTNEDGAQFVYNLDSSIPYKVPRSYPNPSGGTGTVAVQESYFVWEGKLKTETYSQTVSPRQTTATVNFKVYNQANPAEYGFTGDLTITNIPPRGNQ